VEFRTFLEDLGYKSKRTDSAWICHQAGKHLLVFRLYRDDEAVDERDVRVTRTFLDGWGLLAVEDFDTFLQQKTTPA